MFNFFREVRTLFRFFLLPQAKREIVFYAENEGFYPYFEGIIDELIHKHKQKICYITSGKNDPILNSHHSSITPFYSSVLLPIFMLVMRCKVCVMTLNDLQTMHVKRSIYDTQYVYVPHTLASTHMVFRFGALLHYDSVLCAGPYQYKEIKKQEELYSLPKKDLVQAGYYRLERIYKGFREAQKEPLASQTTVLIAPSWGKDNILESCGKELVGVLLKARFRVVVRPHPETIKRSPLVIEEIVNRFGKYENFSFEETIAFDQSLLAADVLISDYSGVALEYAFGTERPVLFLDMPLKIHNPRYKELELDPVEVSLRSKIGVVLDPEQLEKAPEKIQELLDSKDKYQNDLRELREQNIYAFGRSSEIGALHVMKLLTREEQKPHLEARAK